MHRPHRVTTNHQPCHRDPAPPTTREALRAMVPYLAVSAGLLAVLVATTLLKGCGA